MSPIDPQLSRDRVASWLRAPMPRLRPLAILLSLALAVGLLSACTGGAQGRGVGEAGGDGGKTSGGDAVAPAPVEGGERYLFRTDQPPVEIRDVTRDAISALPKLDGLDYVPLPSTEGTVAVSIIEDAPDEPWGSVVNEARTVLFQEFASNDAMGEWLILVTDVVVHMLQDPIPPTAYRWPRAEVEEFAACGIPQSGTNQCSTEFFRLAESVVLAQMGGPNPGR